MPFPQWVTRTNKLVLNPLIMNFAPNRPPFAVVHHVGRRSGRDYATPVLAFATPGAHGGIRVVFALTYGRDVDWVRNVEAAGTLRLTRKGVEYEIARLTTPTADAGLELVPRWTATILRAAHVSDFLMGSVRRAPR